VHHQVANMDSGNWSRFLRYASAPPQAPANTPNDGYAGDHRG
jgi:hypothetical protein